MCGAQACRDPKARSASAVGHLCHAVDGLGALAEGVLSLCSRREGAPPGPADPTDGALINGRAYRFVVVASSAHGMADPSEPVVFVARAAPAAPVLTHCGAPGSERAPVQSNPCCVEGAQPPTLLQDNVSASHCQPTLWIIGI